MLRRRKAQRKPLGTRAPILSKHYLMRTGHYTSSNISLPAVEAVERNK